MKLNIASEPRPLIQMVKVAVEEFFREFVCLVKKGIGLGVVLFLALTTLSFLNHGTHFLKDSVSVRVAQVMTRGSQSSVSPGQGNLSVQRPVLVAPTVWDRSDSQSVQTNARETLRESGYFVGELERFTRTLSRLGK